MKPKSVYSKVAKDLDIPEEIIEITYKLYWMFIRKTIKDLPLKEELTPEEFDSLRVDFNVPSLGKLICDRDSYFKIKNIERVMLWK